MLALQPVVADRALGEADDRPRPLARIEPGFEPLLARASPSRKLKRRLTVPEAVVGSSSM
jgi:hypothetical protein